MDAAPMPALHVLSELKKAFSQGRQGSLQVTGTSMVPFLRHKKDWVLLRPPAGEPQVGQILLFRVGDRLVLHRLRRKKQKHYIMNGDGQATWEEIAPEQVEAVVTAVIRQSGRILPCDGMAFRLLSALWWPTRPVRPLLIKMAQWGKRTLGKGRRSLD